MQMIERLERLYSAVVADCLDRVGLRTQVLDARIRPLDPGSRIAGYAATVHFVEVDGVPESSDDWYRNLLAAIDALRPGAAGIHCADSLGRLEVDAFGVPVECGGVEVAPGDLVLGDHDGVVVVPSARAEEVIRLAEEKVAGENLVREKLAEGMPVSEAFRTYGVI